MPLRRLLGCGFLTVGMIACATLICIALVARQEGGGALVALIIGFATSTILGVLAVIGKLEALEEKLRGNADQLAQMHQDVQKCLAGRSDGSGDPRGPPPSL